jgi:prepilin signal peptidase PulO-like enzyme (type II secretory pathway)
MVLFLLFFLGLMVGSFLNVLIYRTTIGEDWVKGRSRCDGCKEEIAWYDNIPLLSFVILGGKCRHCKMKISIQHVVVELLTGTLFLWWYLIGFTFFRLAESPLSVLQPLFWLVVGILLLIIFVTDWLYQIIPLYANFGLMGLALIVPAGVGVFGGNDVARCVGFDIGGGGVGGVLTGDASVFAGSF